MPFREPPKAGANPPAFNVPPATLAVTIVLIGVFALLHLLPLPASFRLETLLSFHANYLLAALDGRVPLWPAVLQLFSHQFLHVDLLHLVVNAGFLLAFASPVERIIGAPRFVLLFLASGVAGAFAETWFFTGPAGLGVPMLGASGAIMGLMGVALIVGSMAGVLRPAVLRIILVLTVLNVGVGLLSEAGFTGPYLIGWRAHLGGFALGLIVGWFLARRLRARMRR